MEGITSARGADPQTYAEGLSSGTESADPGGGGGWGGERGPPPSPACALALDAGQVRVRSSPVWRLRRPRAKPIRAPRLFRAQLLPFLAVSTGVFVCGLIFFFFPLPSFSLTLIKQKIHHHYHPLPPPPSPPSPLSMFKIATRRRRGSIRSKQMEGINYCDSICKMAMEVVKNETKKTPHNCFLFTNLNKQNSLPRGVCLSAAALLLCRS